MLVSLLHPLKSTVFISCFFNFLHVLRTRLQLTLISGRGLHLRHITLSWLPHLQNISAAYASDVVDFSYCYYPAALCILGWASSVTNHR